MNMNEQQKKGAIEALLFYYGEPMEAAKIAKFLGFKEEECSALLEELSKNLDADEESGLTLLKNDGKVQLATKPSLGWISKKLIEDEFKEELTPAALETIAIIAYLGPVARSVIDYIRGVNSTFILRNLLIRGLVGRELQDGKKNIYEYTVSFDFLKHLGIRSVEDLPEYQKYKHILESFEQTEGKEQPEEQQVPLPNEEEL